MQTTILYTHTHTHTDIYIYIYVKSNILVQPITSYEYLNLDDHFSVGVFKLVHFKLVIIYL